MRFDRVNPVAVGADWCHPISLGDALSVDAPLELLGDILMALAAGRRHVELENRRLGIFRIENFMRAVTIGADRRFLGSGSDGVPMNAFLIRRDHLRALAAIFHHKFLAVAGAAGRWNIGVMHARLGIARREQFMWAAVAIDAGGSVHASSDGPGMKAAIVCGLLIGVTARTADFLGRGFMNRTFDVVMAIDAGKHAAVDRIFERLRIYIQTDRLAIHIMGQRGVAVAGEAIIGSRLRSLFSAGGKQIAGCQNQGESDPGRKKSPYCSRGHTSTRQSFRIY